MIQKQVADRDIEKAKKMEVGTSSVREMGTPGSEKDDRPKPNDRRGNSATR